MARKAKRGGARSAAQKAAQAKAAKASAAARSRKSIAKDKARHGFTPSYPKGSAKEKVRMADFKKKYAKEEASEHAAWATRGARSAIKGIKSGPSSKVSERASEKNYNKVRDYVFKKTGVTGGVGTVYPSRRFGTQNPQQVRARARAGDKDAQREWNAFQNTREKIRGKRLKD